MDFLKYSQPVWWLFFLGLISAITLPLIPHVRETAAYVVALSFICFGLLALYACWVDWKAQKKARNTYTVEPFKKRLEKFHQRKNLQKGR
jgi:predicted ABC-type exoprotein transport system permease subunit